MLAIKMLSYNMTSTLITKGAEIGATDTEGKGWK